MVYRTTARTASATACMRTAAASLPCGVTRLEAHDVVLPLGLWAAASKTSKGVFHMRALLLIMYMKIEQINHQVTHSLINFLSRVLLSTKASQSFLAVHMLGVSRVRVACMDSTNKTSTTVRCMVYNNTFKIDRSGDDFVSTSTIGNSWLKGAVPVVRNTCAHIWSITRRLIINASINSCSNMTRHRTTTSTESCVSYHMQRTVNQINQSITVIHAHRTHSTTL